MTEVNQGPPTVSARKEPESPCVERKPRRISRFGFVGLDKIDHPGYVSRNPTSLVSRRAVARPHLNQRWGPAAGSGRDHAPYSSVAAVCEPSPGADVRSRQARPPGVRLQEPHCSGFEAGGSPPAPQPASPVSTGSTTRCLSGRAACALVSRRAVARPHLNQRGTDGGKQT